MVALFTTVSCLYTEEAVVALERHPLGEPEFETPGWRDYHLFRDWVANHLLHGIVPPLADAVHYLTRHRAPADEQSPPPPPGGAKPERFCFPEISKVLGYLVVAISLADIGNDEEAQAILELVEEILKICLTQAGSLQDFFWSGTDPVVWVALATVYDKLGFLDFLAGGASNNERRSFSSFPCMFWNRAGTRGAGDAAQQKSSPGPPTKFSTSSGVPEAAQEAAKGVAVAEALQQLRDERNGPPDEVELAVFNMIRVVPELRENCFTKQGHHVFAAYEDNLQRCLGGRKLLQLFTWEKDRFVPVLKSPGGWYLAGDAMASLHHDQQGREDHQEGSSSTTVLLSGTPGELMTFLRDEFGRRRFLVYDPRFRLRDNLYASLADPVDEPMPALLVEPTSSEDHWNREWLESYLQAMENWERNGGAFTTFS